MRARLPDRVAAVGGVFNDRDIVQDGSSRTTFVARAETSGRSIGNERLTSQGLAYNAWELSSSVEGSGLSAGVPPSGNLFESMGTSVFKEADAVSGVLEFVNIRPDLGLPAPAVDGRLTAGGAAGVEFATLLWPGLVLRQLDEDAPDFLYIFILPNDMFVAQEISEPELPGLPLRLRPSLKGAKLGPQLLGRITRHPEGFFMDHPLRPRRNFANRSAAPKTGNANFPRRAFVCNSDSFGRELSHYF